MRPLSTILLSILLAGVVSAQTHYQYVARTDRDHSFLGLDCNISGEMLEPGDELGVFDPDGVCAGVGIAEDDEGMVGVAMWGDDTSSHNIDEGFETGEEWVLFFWDRDKQIELPVTMDIDEGPNRWESYGMTVAFLSAEGIPRIIVAEHEHDFGLLDMVVGEPVVWETTIRNTGNGDLILGDMAGAGDSAFFDIDFSDREIEMDGVATVTVTFPQGAYQPGAAYQTTLTIQTNTEQDIVFTLRGAIGAPRYMIEQISFNFGEASLIENDQDIPLTVVDTVTVENEGTATLLLTVDLPDGVPFFLPEGDPLEFSVAPGASAMIRVIFDPDIEGEFATEMTIETNGHEQEADIIVRLSGRGVLPSQVGRQVEAPLDFRVLSAHPNPFNNQTTINFNLAHDSRVVLAAFDMHGREVLRLVDGNLSAGAHWVTWPAARLNTGAYILKMATSGVILTEQVVLMR